MTLNCLVFDIETVPDTDLGRRILGLGDADDDAVAERMFAVRQEATGSDFLPFEQHRIVAVSAVLRSGEQFHVWSLGGVESPEDELVSRFFAGLEKTQPTLVSWNGGGFDLPVLHYRALKHGIVSRRYWEVGDVDPGFRHNNYLGRFHWRHIDVMDVLAGYQARGRASLENVAALLGLPGKLGMSGDRVWGAYREGRLAEIRAYCETDVLNTYLVYLRFELIRGRLSPEDHEAEIARVWEWLEERGEPHWQQFAAAWDVT
ncbi:MAG: 3-5 exonuclease [Proteobacteria bacterium]|nr:3-5 exonuclease [Pseudomonadota bacterium]